MQAKIRKKPLFSWPLASARNDVIGFTNDLTNFRHFWPAFYMSKGFYWLDLFIWCVLWCTRSPKTKFPSEVPYSLVIPDPSFSMVFDGFWAVTDQKMAQSGSKIMKCELILNFIVLPAQKFWNYCS
jgi:hypothetical protein